VGGTAVAGTTGGTVVAAGPHAVNSIMTTAIMAKIVLILFIHSLLVIKNHGYVLHIGSTISLGGNLL
jgi:hypothetical protein